MYFFIVNQAFSELVLDISIGKKGGKLVVELAHGGRNQLWRWDEDCRLVSKSGLVADIKGKSEKAGAVCHAWIPHDGLNQKWRVEEGAIKSNLSGLVIDAADPSLTMREYTAGCPSQMWYFIPEKAWDDFQLVQADPNPLNKAQFWKHLADNYLDVIIGYTIDDYEHKVHKASKIIEECASKLDEVAKDTGIATTVGGSAQVIGGGVTIAGVFLAPVTAGVSLVLTIGGMAISAAGGVTSFGSSVGSHVWDTRKNKETIKATAPLFRATLSLCGFLHEYNKLLEDATEFLQTPQGKAVAKDAFAQVKFDKEVELAVSAGLKVYKVANAISTGAKQLKKAKGIKALVTMIDADSCYVVSEAKVALASQAAAPGVKVFGKTVVAAGSVGAKALSGSLAGLGILSGAWDIYGGAEKIKNGSELAAQFRKTSEVLREESSKLIRFYKEL